MKIGLIHWFSALMHWLREPESIENVSKRNMLLPSAGDGDVTTVSGHLTGNGYFILTITDFTNKT